MGKNGITNYAKVQKEKSAEEYESTEFNVLMTQR